MSVGVINLYKLININNNLKKEYINDFIRINRKFIKNIYEDNIYLILQKIS